MLDKLTLTLKLPAGVEAWLAAEGDPQYRSAKGQAEYLCAQYLIRTYKAATQPQKNGTPPPRRDTSHAVSEPGLE